MGSEPLIQKLFALERAVGKVGNATLRAMIIEAEEAALAMDREILLRLRADQAGLGAMTNGTLARDLATRAVALPGPDPVGETPGNAFPIRYSEIHRRSA